MNDIAVSHFVKWCWVEMIPPNLFMKWHWNEMIHQRDWSSYWSDLNFKMWHFHIAKDDIMQQNLKYFIWSFSFFILVSQCLRSAEQWIMTCLNVSQFFIIHHINIKPARKFLKAHKKIQIYLALALSQFPPKWKPHNIRTSNPVEKKREKST